jgi:hypothetical protein
MQPRLLLGIFKVNSSNLILFYYQVRKYSQTQIYGHFYGEWGYEIDLSRRLAIKNQLARR